MNLRIQAGYPENAVQWETIYGDEAAKRIAELTLPNKMELLAYVVDAESIVLLRDTASAYL